jgi:hypothetical protein
MRKRSIAKAEDSTPGSGPFSLFGGGEGLTLAGLKV